MRNTGNVPVEMIALVAMAIAAVALPAAVGFGVVTLYRRFRPIEKEEVVSLATLGNNKKDGFFTFLVVGWVICGPIFYWLYSLKLFG